MENTTQDQVDYAKQRIIALVPLIETLEAELRRIESVIANRKDRLHKHQATVAASGQHKADLERWAELLQEGAA